MTPVANTLPTKRFFIDTFTRDISLEDSILDLIDNAIDSFVRTREVQLDKGLLDEGTVSVGRLGEVTVSIGPDRFQIKDRCGGITRKAAEEEVFRLGATTERSGVTLGVYGIGLKRALFKIGRHVVVESRTADEGFKVDFDVLEWEKQDDWVIPLEYTEGAGDQEEAGTTITITQLNDNVRMKVAAGTVAKRIQREIARTYALFLNRLVRVSVNGSPVDPKELPLGLSDEVSPGRETFVHEGVHVDILAGLADRREWNTDTAGWYVFCNGRLVVAADKTELTGWTGRSGLSPQYVSKYRGFVGIALFFSDNPLGLPWTTTKRGLNVESPVFQRAKNLMVSTAKPVLTFLNKMYRTDPKEEPEEREIAETIHRATLKDALGKSTGSFQVTPSQERKPKATVGVQYDAKIADIERAKKCLRKSKWSARRVGEYALEYFLKMECPE